MPVDEAAGALLMVTCAEAMGAACTQLPKPAPFITHTPPITKTPPAIWPNKEVTMREAGRESGREIADMSWRFASMINIYILIC